MASTAAAEELVEGSASAVHTAVPARLLLPTIAVDAPVVVLGNRPSGEMDSPDGPTDIGWYTFSPTPGNPGNTVFSGHRDWHTGVTGVLWRLGELAPGDPVTVVLADDSLVSYTVQTTILGASDSLDVLDVVGPTQEETITLITCEGWFDSTTHDYDRRRIVRAIRSA